MSKRFESGKEEIGAASQCCECRQPCDFLADGTFGNFEFKCAVLISDNGVALVTKLVKVTIIYPDVLREFKLSNNLILSVLTILQISLRRHGIETETQLDDKLPLVEGNKVQLQQVVLNLVTNAIDAMQSTTLRRLRVCSSRSDSGNVRVTIEDTGPGIDPQNIDLVFKPLFTTKQSGMGMGLSICRSIVEAHGGHIIVSSGSRGGATFELELPRKQRVAV